MSKSSRQRKKKIVIVGAGYTGLAAAISLLERDFEVVLIDASPAVGGLAADFTIEGEPIEKAYHHYFKTDVHLIHMAEKLGLSDKMIWLRSSIAIVYKHKIWPFTTPLDLLRFKPLSLFNRIRAGVVVLFLQKYNNWKSLSPLPAYRWMRRYAGKKVYDVIWKPLLIGKFSQQFYKKISMAWLWARVHVRAQSRSGSDEMLGYFKGGFSIVTDAMVKKINQLGGTFLLNARIEGIAQRPRGYTLKLAGDKRQQADFILLATPSDITGFILQPIARNITQKQYIKSLQATRYIGAICLVFSSKQSLSKYYWHNVNDLETPFLAFIQHTNLVDKATYRGKHVYYLATYLPHEHPYFELEPEKLEATWFDHLQKIVPEFDASKIHEKHLFRFKKAQHLAFLNYEEKLPAHKSPFPNIFVSNFAQIYPEDRGTNYAIRDGEMVAKLIADAAQES